MDNIKLETELRLETLFISITHDDINKLSEILNTPEVDVLEKQLIRKYQVLTKDINDIPSIETLKKEFPSLYFDDVKPIESAQINDYINLFISNRKNISTANKLLELSSLVKTNGLNEKIITTLDNITKSDTVKREFIDVSKNILDVYKDKDNNLGFKTGVPQIDELTGGFKLGSLNTILGYTGGFKTTWAVNISYQAIKDNHNVLYLSLEVPKEDLMFNVLSRHSYDEKFDKSIPKDDLIARKLKPELYDYFQNVVYPDYLKLPGNLYFLDETDLDSYSTFAIENKFREIDNKSIEETSKGIELVVIDHAQLLKFTNSSSLIGKETSVINQYVSFFRKNAINWIKEGRKTCMIMLSQASREGWKEAQRNEGQYKLTALAEANELERASAMVVSTYSTESLINMKSAKVRIIKE